MKRERAERAAINRKPSGSKAVGEDKMKEESFVRY